MRMKVTVMVLALMIALSLEPRLLAQQSPGSVAAQQQPQNPTPQPVPLPEKNPEPQPPDSQNNQQPGDPASSQAAQPTMKTFSGTIVKVSDKFVLQDTATNTNYELANQAKAKQYEGRQVVVTGSLETST